ncbi:CapA family protein [Streptomyces albidoflavus]|uniref:CapA family protein n=2 Tax=Streptomyces albidoflavus TaxID=1886 RepID=UPI002254141C|nr:CapA family protein [Streptomyces albidoflavus]MCX4442888.1 CapA family protein [Streptomyces albidoflavus]
MPSPHRRTLPRRTAALATALTLGALAAGCAEPGPPAPRPGAAAPPAPAPGRFTLVATGDILAHDAVIRQAAADASGVPDRDAGPDPFAPENDGRYDFAPMLAGARAVTTGADLAVCHLETIVGEDNGPFTGYPLFKTPPHIARAIRSTGYDTCSTASNHAMDDGEEGVRRTLDALDRADVAHTGTARAPEDRARPLLLRAGDARVAHLSYVHWTNKEVPPGKPYLVDQLDPDQVVADARNARAAGADVVIASVHWGTEWQEAPDRQQREVARQLTASRSQGRRDIDLILGTHAHVPQAYEKVNGTWVVYGMGDQVAGEMTDPRGQLGSAARFTFTEPREPGAAWQVTSAEYIPHRMANDPLRLVNLPRATERPTPDPEDTAALAAVRKAVLSRGADQDGLRMGR